MRRRAFSLPYGEEVRTLAPLVRSEPAPETRSARLVEAALHHRVSGYLARAVEAGDVELQARDRGRLARIGAVQILHSRALRRELRTIEPLLASACDAPPVCIKGPAVADRLYPDPRLRTFADLDLIVARERLDVAAQALVKQGY